MTKALHGRTYEVKKNWGSRYEGDIRPTEHDVRPGASVRPNEALHGIM